MLKLEMNSSNEGVRKLFDFMLDPNRGWFERICQTLPHALDRQLDRYLLTNGLDSDSTGVVCVAITLQLIENIDKFKCVWIRSDSPAQLQFNLPARAGALAIDTTVEFNTEAIEAIPEDCAEQKHFYSMVLQAYPHAWKWIVQLSACYQVNYNRLDISAVTNYFKQLPEIQPIVSSFDNTPVSGASVHPYIKFSATCMKLLHKLVDDEQIRTEFLSDSLFVKRYATFSATAGICRQMIDGLGLEFSLKIIGAEMIKVVDESLTNYWDANFNEKIPDKLRAMAAVYAQVHEINYGNWTQGKKALAKFPSFVNSWRALFRRLKQRNQQ
ncbi:hypothetical protein DAPPUDRAFT_97441 [Daphnia pulex]|uniref:Uncharacterized protein n=1 Tax=Daphnia pulex TaxID=6669 RepID=E9G018_DAPPU|nr:hypothetical protein DAPPUDRAFT_97441 [Daphnia pulex]|eukprot:EFX87150.1 hypothetical protein DAPPUDRAFT_97441 [Daphnia pulex]